LYSQPSGHWPLDALATRTFHFGCNILKGLDCFAVEEPVREVIRRGANLLLIDTIGRTGQFYSEDYLRELEVYSPFRFSFLNEQRVDFFKRHGSLGQLMETVMAFQVIGKEN